MDDLAEILGRSQATEALRVEIRRLIARPSTGPRLPSVLLNGETGTGKGLVARVLHRASLRAKGPFVDVNCAAIPESLLEAELFGYERGAFTDARQPKAGLFQTAHRGTLFLDEIGLLAETLQAKLLKVIEERTVRRLGGTRSEPFDAWLLCATNEDLPSAILARRFREDLYHRIAVVTLRLPPLRERVGDVLLLADEFLARVCSDYGLAPKTLAADARARLTAYPWPGNIRELSNVMERAALVSEEPVITAGMLALPDRRVVEPIATALARPAPLDDTVRDHLLATLDREQWNISRTAAALGVTRNTVRARIARFSLERGARSGRSALLPPARETRPAWHLSPGAVPAPAIPPTIRWERRQIALLRATLVTPPGADTALDTSRVIEALLEKVHIFAGRVEEVSPTSIGAAFGLDDVEEAPRRAAHAAMAMQRALARGPVRDGQDFAAVIGLHVDQLLVGKSGGTPEIDADGKRAAWGTLDTLLADIAPGAVGVTAAAAPLLERRFSLAALVAAGPAGYRLLGHERPGLRSGTRMSPFVGRRQEIDILESRLASATAGHGQLVGIAGEAGLGKSRLLHEFRQRLRGRPITWLEAHCVSHGGNIPYLPLLELVRRGSRLDERDTPDGIDRKVRHTLEMLGLDPADAAYVVAFLGPRPAGRSLDAPTPEIIRARTLNVLRQMAIHASRRRPLVIVVEDLHWIDTASTAVASRLEGLDRLPVLVVFTYRPGYTLPWLDRSAMTQVALQPLTREESALILHGIDGAAAIPGIASDLIISQAEGNPFFLEELARAAVEQGSAAPPASVQHVLLARITQLSDEAKGLLEMAAVLGRQASVRLLGEMWTDVVALEAVLLEVVRHEFLYPGESPTGEVIYTFKHALIQEVVYRNLLEPERRRLHASAGRALESLYAGRHDEVAEMLAHHFGASDLDDKAVDYAIRAGEKAIHRWANTEALAAFEAALARLDRMPDVERNRLLRIDALLKQSEVRFALGEHSRHLAALEAIRPIIESSADPPRRALWHYWMGFLHDLTGRDPEDTIAYCRQASAIAETAGLDDVQALVDSCLAQAYGFRGELRQALAAGVRALAFFEPRGGLWWACRTLWHLVVASMAVGEWDRALDYCQRALAHAEAMDDRRLRVRTLTLTGSVHIQRGDPETGLEWCARARALSPMPFDASVIDAIRGYGLVKRGDVESGCRALRDAVAWFASARLRFSSAMTRLRLAEACVRIGNVEEATSILGDVLSDTRAAGYRYAEAIAHRLMGEAALATNAQRARADLDVALRLFEEVGAQHERAKTLVAMAEARRAARDPQGARALLERALGIFEALGTLDEPARVRALLSQDTEPGE